MKLEKVGEMKAVVVRRPAARRLIVLLYGWTDRPQTFAELLPHIERAFPDSDLLIPKMPLAWASLTNLDELAEQLAFTVEEFAATDRAGAPRYARITLLGHSCGGILARQLFLAAHGVQLKPGRVHVPDQPARP